MSQSETASTARFGQVLCALGVVYGDIGTSPLYALRECFSGSHSVPLNPDNLLGVLSLIVWSLIVIVCIKYLWIVMRANNKGEGGILALLALALGPRVGKVGGPLMALGVFGAALLYGDGMITPAITVLSAIEGLKVATNQFETSVVPLTVVILIILFSFQRIGTGNVGKIFGPVMLLWFVVLMLLGIRGILMAPTVLHALNPWLGIHFLLNSGVTGFLVLGSVFLAVTGAEALYADMGHFGLPPIRRAWFLMVFPGLVLNYFGQGALLLSKPEASENPFYLLAPTWSLYPLVALSTLASVIASQALISGAFSLTMQAMQLGYVPRLNIQHTSSTERGQIYIAPVNWALMLSCIALVVFFKTSNNLAAAYGIAVTLTMIITTILFGVTAYRRWNWPAWRVILICGCFLSLEFAFLGSNAVKFAQGGWFSIFIGLFAYLLMSTWKRGRQLVYEQIRKGTLPLDLFLQDVELNPPVRVKGTAVFLCGSADGTPQALLHNLKHNKIIHDRTVFLHISTADSARVDASERLTVTPLSHGFYRVKANYGFMEEPNVEDILQKADPLGLEYRPMETTYFLGRETILPARNPGMARWREYLFAFMSRNAQQATAFFKLPANRVVELGMQVEI